MKLSRYNILRKYEDTTVFFNATTCALAVVDDNFLAVLDDIENNAYDESKYDKELIENMKISGCIIDDDIDEIEQLEFFRNLSKYDKTNFGLTVAPTLDCNFRCKYCFETHPKGVMTDEVQSDLLKFIEERLTAAKHFSLTWYGGEPLMAKDIIYNLSEKILTLCEKYGADYDAFIITNAYLMEDSDIKNFKKYKINGAQITIDGPKEIHDKRRLSLRKESTFDKLIDRVNALLNNDFSVIVRINIDKENIDYVDELLQILKIKIEKFENLKIDFGQVSTYTDICKSIESDCYNNAQYADIMLPLYAKVAELGFTVNKMSIYPSPRVNYCCYDYANSFVVDNLGEIYRCWNHVGNIKKSCGNVTNFNVDKLKANYLSAIQRNPTRDLKCRDCNCLPICMGGCPDAMNNASNNQPVCGTIKYNLDKVISYYYEQLKGDITK